MNGRTAKLLRKVAKISGRTDTYIKKTYKNMTPDQRKAYLSFVVSNFMRAAEEQKKTSTSLDVPEREGVVDGK